MIMNITDLSKAILTDQYLNQIKNAAFTAVSNYEKTHSILEANRAVLKEALIADLKAELKEGDQVLIKSSNGTGLLSVVDALKAE